MRKLFSYSSKQGLPPGTMVYTGTRRDEPMLVTVIDYDAEKMTEIADAPIESCVPYRDTTSVTWINIDGLNDTAAIERLGTQFGLHPLVLEDILHIPQRPKLEDLGEYLFLVVHMLYFPKGSDEMALEQVSFVLANHCLLSFQERPGDVFDLIRNRIRNNIGKVRKMGADYLLFALLDAIVDNYFSVMELTGAAIEDIERDIIADPSSYLLKDIYRQRQELLYIRKSVWPMREAFGALERSENPLMKKRTHAYMRDLYDHTVHVIDSVEAFRDMLTSVQDLYLSTLGSRSNQVMQVLTVIATIFMPLTFIVGLYGMNFRHMPELEWRYGYPAVWVVMAAVAAGMLLYFRGRKWF